jgi:hypothetical protein
MVERIIQEFAKFPPKRFTGSNPVLSEKKECSLREEHRPPKSRMRVQIPTFLETEYSIKVVY